MPSREMIGLKGRDGPVTALNSIRVPPSWRQRGQRPRRSTIRRGPAGIRCVGVTITHRPGRSSWRVAPGIFRMRKTDMLADDSSPHASPLPREEREPDIAPAWLCATAECLRDGPRSARKGGRIRPPGGQAIFISPPSFSPATANGRSTALKTRCCTLISQASAAATCKKNRWGPMG
jgi:hypothetical protein